MDELAFDGWEFTEDTAESLTAAGPEGSVSCQYSSDATPPWEEWRLTVRARGETLKDETPIKIGDREELFEIVEDEVRHIVSVEDL